jgi:CRP-like cAMP-binding protein
MGAIEDASVNTSDGDGWMCIADGRIADFGQEASSQSRSARPSPTQDRELDAGEHLFFEGDARAHVFVVKSGWVKLYRTLIDGQRQVVGFANAGSILGLESDGDHSNGCQAVTDVIVRSMPIGKIAEICATDGALAQQLLGQLGRQLGAAQAQLATIGAQSAEQKLASFLISMSDLCGASKDEAFRLPMRRGEMGEFLGLRLAMSPANGGRSAWDGIPRFRLPKRGSAHRTHSTWRRAALIRNTH